MKRAFTKDEFIESILKEVTKGGNTLVDDKPKDVWEKYKTQLKKNDWEKTHFLNNFKTWKCTHNKELKAAAAATAQASGEGSGTDKTRDNEKKNQDPDRLRSKSHDGKNSTSGGLFGFPSSSDLSDGGAGLNPVIVQMLLNPDAFESASTYYNVKSDVGKKLLEKGEQTGAWEDLATLLISSSSNGNGAKFSEKKDELGDLQGGVRDAMSNIDLVNDLADQGIAALRRVKLNAGKVLEDPRKNTQDRWIMVYLDWIAGGCDRPFPNECLDEDIISYHVNNNVAKEDGVIVATNPKQKELTPKEVGAMLALDCESIGRLSQFQLGSILRAFNKLEYKRNSHLSALLNECKRQGIVHEDFRVSHVYHNERTAHFSHEVERGLVQMYTDSLDLNSMAKGFQVKSDISFKPWDDLDADDTIGNRLAAYKRESLCQPTPPDAKNKDELGSKKADGASVPADYNGMNVNELKTELNLRGLPCTGLKADLKKRLCDHDEIRDEIRKWTSQQLKKLDSNTIANELKWLADELNNKKM